MKTEFEHIKHQFENIPEKGFFILNEFKSESKNPTLKNIIESDLLNEDYFSTEKQKKETQKQIDRMISFAKMQGAYEVNKNEQIELYGPMLKDKLRSSDFIKLDFKSYLTKIQSYIMEWTDENWNDLVEVFQKFHQIALAELKNKSAEKRTYYFLDAEQIDKEKLYEVNWYEYFFTVISTLENSDDFLIMNYGND
nr:hypothetical protein [uncultured Lacinutrix sp.]